MFWENLIYYCNEKNTSPNNVCIQLGFSSAVATKWKNGSVPRDTTLKKIADYFGVTIENLLADRQEKTPETEVTPSELQDAIEKINAILPNLSDEDKDKLIDYGHYLIQKQNK